MPVELHERYLDVYVLPCSTNSCLEFHNGQILAVQLLQILFIIQIFQNEVRDVHTFVVNKYHVESVHVRLKIFLKVVV